MTAGGGALGAAAAASLAAAALAACGGPAAVSPVEVETCLDRAGLEPRRLELGMVEGRPQTSLTVFAPDGRPSSIDVYAREGEARAAERTARALYARLGQGGRAERRGLAVVGAPSGEGLEELLACVPGEG